MRWENYDGRRGSGWNEAGGIFVQYLCQASSRPGFLTANSNNTLLLYSLQDSGSHSVNDDVPHVVLGLCTNETLSADASVQEIDASEALAALNRVRANTILELAKDLLLPRLAHGLILGTLDGCAEVIVDSEQDIVDSDIGLPRRQCGVWVDVELPWKVTYAKAKSLQRRVGGRIGEDGWREVWVVLGGGITDVVLEAGRDEGGMKTYARCERCRWDKRECICLGDRRGRVDARVWRGRIGRERRRGVGWRRKCHVWERWRG
jgi:hypothetical protein